jgi:hypothetical protein
VHWFRSLHSSRYCPIRTIRLKPARRFRFPIAIPSVTSFDV